MSNLYDNICQSSDVFIIAEAGINHNGNIDTAKQLVDAAVEAGVDAVKFQTFKTEKIIGRYAKLADYQKDNINHESSQFSMAKKYELSYDDFRTISDYCKEKDITFLSTPDDEDSLDFLVGLDVPLLKIGSTEITNHPFLCKIGSYGIPTILSTGMSLIGEIDDAIRMLMQSSLNKIVLMHCTTAYPTAIANANVRAIHTLREAFGLPVGFSDHTVGYESALVAVALGASVIEKHFTISRTMDGPDHHMSLEPIQLKQFVNSIRDAKKALGSGRIYPDAIQLHNAIEVRRSIVAAHQIEKGEVINDKMLTLKRPGWGLPPSALPMLFGRIAKRHIEEDEPILWEDV